MRAGGDELCLPAPLPVTIILITAVEAVAWVPAVAALQQATVLDPDTPRGHAGGLHS